MSKPHFILIHGAYHRAWHLHLLKSELEKTGHSVTTIDLPSGNEDAPQVNAMSADTEAIKSVLETAASQSSSIVPVFHSYAGIPGSEAVAELSESAKKKVLRLIYLAAILIPQGTALTTGSGGKTAAWSAVMPDGKFVYVPEPIPTFYHDVEPLLAQEAASRCVKNSRSAFAGVTKHAGWEDFPCTYVLCKDDRTVPPAVCRKMFERLGEQERKTWTLEEIEGGHSPFLSRPGELARLLRRVVAGYSG